MSTPAEIYERWFVPALFAPLAMAFLDDVRPRPGARVLDVACGTGIVARRVAPCVGAGGRVVGLDLSSGMLAVARTAAADEGATVEWQVGTAEALPFQDGSFDLIVSQQGLQFVPDKLAALAEMHRVLAGDGHLALTVWQGLDRHPLYAALHAAFLRQSGDRAMETPFSLGEATVLRQLLGAAGFREVTIESLMVTASFPHPERYVELQVSASAAALPALQRLDASARQERIDAIRAELEPTIRELTVDDRLVAPMHAHLARGWR